MFYSHQNTEISLEKYVIFFFLFTIREFSKEGTSKYRWKNNMWIPFDLKGNSDDEHFALRQCSQPVISMLRNLLWLT